MNAGLFVLTPLGGARNYQFVAGGAEPMNSVWPPVILSSLFLASDWLIFRLEHSDWLMVTHLSWVHIWRQQWAKCHTAPSHTWTETEQKLPILHHCDLTFLAPAPALHAVIQLGHPELISTPFEFSFLIILYLNLSDNLSIWIMPSVFSTCVVCSVFQCFLLDLEATQMGI